MVNLLFAREDILRVYGPLLNKTFLLYKYFFGVIIFPGWSFQNAKNGKNGINQLHFNPYSEVSMGTTDFSISDTLLGTYNFGHSGAFFLQLKFFRFKPRRKKSTFWWKVEILTSSENLNFQKLSKSLWLTEIMFIVASFHHNRHLSIHKSIQNMGYSGKMGHFEL